MVDKELWDIFERLSSSNDQVISPAYTAAQALQTIAIGNKLCLCVCFAG